VKRTFLGDIHGAWGMLNEILKRHKDIPSIQVGDLGLGFVNSYTFLNQRTGLWETKGGIKDPKEFPKKFRFIRGNHDNPEVCRKHPNYLGDYGVDKETGIFFVSGAWSIDVNYRTPDIDWWYEEELDYPELQKVIELYEKTKPSVVVSHTCPSSIAKLLAGGNFHGSKTENALETMWEIHKPKYWIFGHWHMVWRKNILGTDFICCAINARITLDI
jgi:Icc-related predicted phosphoesterase